MDKNGQKTIDSELIACMLEWSGNITKSKFLNTRLRMR